MQPSPLSLHLHARRSVRVREIGTGWVLLSTKSTMIKLPSALLLLDCCQQEIHLELPRYQTALTTRKPPSGRPITPWGSRSYHKRMAARIQMAMEILYLHLVV